MFRSTTDEFDVRQATMHLVEETKQRARQIQKLAFEASASLSEAPSDSNYFLVSREVHSGLFYGFQTNFGFELLSSVAASVAKSKKKKVEFYSDEEDENDLVGLFRDRFEINFRRRNGLLKRLTDFLSSVDKEGRYSVLVSYDYSGELKASRCFDESYNDSPEVSKAFRAILEKEKIDIGDIHTLAKMLASNKTQNDDLSGQIGKGFHLIVRNGGFFTQSPEIRRQPLRLVQMCLRTGLHDTELDEKSLNVPTEMRPAFQCSLVTSYSILYERERYFEKAVRQAIKGTIVKWGEVDDKSTREFESQLDALVSCNRPYITHAAPHLIKCGFPSAGTGTKYGDANKDPDTSVPWYEMPWYGLPSMHELLTTTAGLKEFEVRALAKAVFQHLNAHFWKITKSDDTRQESGYLSFGDITVSAVPSAVLRTIMDEIEAATVKIEERLEQWKNDNPIRIGKSDLTVPDQKWEDFGDCLIEKVLSPESCSDESGCDQNGSSTEKVFVQLKMDFDNNSDSFDSNSEATGNPDNHVSGKPIMASNPFPRVRELYHKWSTKHEATVSLPILKATDCHGDPHFENIFVDASVPEDAFIVAIDPAKRSYSNVDAGKSLDGSHELSPGTGEKMFDCIGQQPMQDIAKILLSTTGGYSLVMKSGFKGDLQTFVEGSEKSWIYDLSWKAQSSSLPIGQEAGGVSGARLIKRAVSATNDAKKYNVVFADEVLEQFLSMVEGVLEKSNETRELQRIRCKNIYLLQIWSLLVRHVFSISEKLFPDRTEKADQIFAIGLVLLERGAEIIEGGPECLSKAETTTRFRQILTLTKMGYNEGAINEQ